MENVGNAMGKLCVDSSGMIVFMQLNKKYCNIRSGSIFKRASRAVNGRDD